MPTVVTDISTGPAHVHYELAGAGPAVVLVHGTGASGEQWGPLAAALADGYRVIMPDCSGSGRTTDPGGPLTLADLVSEVLAVADDAHAERFHLVGHSLGAVIATQLAASRPDRVVSLALHAGWVRTDVRMAAIFNHWLDLIAPDSTLGGALLAQAITIDAFGPRYWRTVTDEAHRDLLAQLAPAIAPGTDRQLRVDLEVDLTDLLHSISTPTLVLASSHDQIVPNTQQQALLAGIANARYAEIDAGHGAPAEYSDGFNTRIRGFLDQQSPNVRPTSAARSD